NHLHVRPTANRQPAQSLGRGSEKCCEEKTVSLSIAIISSAHGKTRVRFRTRSLSLYLTGTPWSEDFMRKHPIALDRVHGASHSKHGSIDALVASYYELIFPTLKPSTQQMRRGVLDRFCAEHGDKPVADIEHHHVTAILMAKSKT